MVEGLGLGLNVLYEVRDLGLAHSVVAVAFCLLGEEL